MPEPTSTAPVHIERSHNRLEGVAQVGVPSAPPFIFSVHQPQGLIDPHTPSPPGQRLGTNQCCTKAGHATFSRPGVVTVDPCCGDEVDHSVVQELQALLVTSSVFRMLLGWCGPHNVSCPPSGAASLG